MESTINKLADRLNSDDEYRYGWVSNIAMAHVDAENQYRREANKVGKYLNKKDRHAIANKAAENFLYVLSL